VTELKWTILVATLGQRGDRFTQLMNWLLPQVEQACGAVHVTALWNNGERPLGHVRQDLIESTSSEYVSFFDDDDKVPDYFVSEILPLLDGVDYVGWRMQCVMNGVPLKPTFHSLRYGRWYDDDHGYYRDLSHLNPIRREHALRVDYRTVGKPEDVAWVDRLRALGIVKTEHYTDRVMYFYHANSNDSTWRGVTTRGTYTRPEIDSPYFTYHHRSSV
jgi:hypothetical protein